MKDRSYFSCVRCRLTHIIAPPPATIACPHCDRPGIKPVVVDLLRGRAHARRLQPETELAFADHLGAAPSFVERLHASQASGVGAP